MLAKASDALPAGEGWLFEPKWDGFRAIVFRDGPRLHLQSRELKPLDRYFPELEAPLRARLPARCVVDGEIVIAGDRGLDFEALLLRIHPAASRVKQLAAREPGEPRRCSTSSRSGTATCAARRSRSAAPCSSAPSPPATPARACS